MNTNRRLTDEDLRELLPRCLAKDEGAWETLFNGLYGLVKSIVLKIHRNDDDVEDAVADAFRNVVDAIGDVAEARNPLGYIGAVARHAALASRKRVCAVAEHEAFSFTADDSDGASDSDKYMAVGAEESPAQPLGLLKGQVEKAVAGLLSKLSAEDRRLLRLKFHNDLSYAEMGYIYGKDEGALRVAVCRLVKELSGGLDADIREAGRSDPRLLTLLTNLGLTRDNIPATGENDNPQADLLKHFIDDPESMSAENRRKVELELQRSTDFRELKILLERKLVTAQYDVVGHAEFVRMPDQMLRELMQHAIGESGD